MSEPSEDGKVFGETVLTSNSTCQFWSANGIRGMMITLGRRLLSFVAKEYGYKGKEIGQYIQKDPAIVTRDIKEKGQLGKEMEKVIDMIRGKRVHVNNQV